MTPRFWSLVRKELRQIGRDRRLVISLIVPPVVQILLFGFAIDPEVKHLRVGVVDESRTFESRELVSAVTENQTLQLAGSYPSPAALEQALRHGHLDVGIVVPYEYARLRGRAREASVQVLVNGVNTNSAELAEGHVRTAIASLDPEAGTPDAVTVKTAFFSNPGLIHTWFTVTGVLATLIVMNGSIVAATAMIKEKERGTVEQLLMTPASAIEIVAAKIVPLFVLLMAMTGLALTVSWLVFAVPFRGSLLLLAIACACCVLTGIGIGTMVATLSRTATQAQLLMFFINPPLMSLSGALTPLEAMPQWIQPFAKLNPVAHFATLARSVLLKGAGLEVVIVPLVALAAISTVLVAVSAWRFRVQMS